MPFEQYEMASGNFMPSDLDKLLVYQIDHRGRRKFRNDSMEKALGLFDIIRPVYDATECPSTLLKSLLNDPTMWLRCDKCSSILYNVTGVWLDLKNSGRGRVNIRSRAIIWILILLGRATGLWVSNITGREVVHRQVVCKTWYRVSFIMNSVKECQKSVLELLAIRKFRRSEMGQLGILDSSLIKYIGCVLWASRYETVWFRSPIPSQDSVSSSAT